jgi:SAM-dependent methyltransferase
VVRDIGSYDPNALRAYYDAYGPEREWDRLETTSHGRNKYLIHRRLLMRYLTPGMSILDIGCGPGRFALDMLRAGATVSLGDLSGVQLNAAVKRIHDAGLGDHLTDAVEVDMCDLSRFADASLDMAVAYGGVLSYTCEGHERALEELVRVTAPGGFVLLSVMPLAGTMRLIAPLDAGELLRAWDEHMPWDRSEPLPGYVLTMPGSSEWHQPMALFTANYLRSLLHTHGCNVVAMAAANPISTLWPMPSVEADEGAVRRLQELDLAFCETPELVEGGTHMVVVAGRR